MSIIASQPFQFYARQNLPFLTGRRANNLKELLTGIKEITGMSIYYHTHHYLTQHEFLSPEPPNDFAYWVSNALQDKLLGEKIASIDFKRFSSLEHIRAKLIEVIETSLNGNFVSNHHKSPPGEEFHFMSASTFVFPTRYTAQSLGEFGDCLKKVSINSIYYHVFESRFNAEVPEFSKWFLSSLNETKLAEEFNRLDPYPQTLDNLRKMIYNLVAKRLKEFTYGKA